MERRLAAIMATDVVGYSRLIRADEEGTVAALKALRADLIDPKLGEHNGRIVKLMGDGMLAEFPSVVDAVRAAVETQQAVTEHNAHLPDDKRIEFRVGVNLGDVVIDGDDIQGDGVNIAARLEGIAQPGGVCISGGAYEQVRDRIDAPFEDLGEQEFKNISRPVRVWQWIADAGLAASILPNLPEPLPLPDKPSIVILPFTNMSGDPEQEYFSDGITEDITTELSRFAELFVIARNTAFAYKDQTPNIMDVARELGVHFVLEGSVRKAGNRVRINAQLIDGQNGDHLWAERYDGKLEEIFDLQDEVTRQVVSATVPHINEAALARIRRGDQIFDDAQDLAWQALDQLENAFRLSQPDLLNAAKAKAYEALERNERCFPAYYVICMACHREILMQWSDDPDESQKQLKEAAETYVSLAPGSHRSHLCSGLAKFSAGHSEVAAQDYRHSIELNPNDAMVLSILSITEVRLGNLNEAKAIAQRAIRLNPKDAWTGTAYLALAQTAFIEDDDQFRHWAERAIRAQPTAPIRRALMIAYAAETGDQALLEEHLRHLSTIAPRFIPSLLSGKSDPFKIPLYREKFLAALRKAVPSE